MTTDPLSLPITIDGQLLLPHQVIDWALQKLAIARHSWEKNLASFVLQWYDPQMPAIAVQSSGSTGEPRIMYFKRETLLESARRTCSFFQLKEGMRALLCLNTSFIAGKMMVVRALAGQLNLIPIPPTTDPLATLTTPADFVAMVPPQIIASLKNPLSRNILLKTHTLLIGGAPLNPEAEASLAKLHNNAWITYGMTETLTHVAIRKAGEIPPVFHPLPGITFKTAADGTLCINAPFLPEEIKTHDQVDLYPDGRFILKGRADFVINSGGVKIFPEQLELRLASFFHRPFFIIGHKHPILGQVPLLVVESHLLTKKDIVELCQFIVSSIPRHQRPVALRPVQKVHRSEGGKILRKQTLEAPENQNTPIIELKYS